MNWYTAQHYQGPLAVFYDNLDVICGVESDTWWNNSESKVRWGKFCLVPGDRDANRKLHRAAGFTSKKSQSVIGVPQGSILSPLLFLISINDMPMTCTKHLPVLFANDTNQVASHEDFNILIKTVCEELSSIAEWFQWNRLTLSVKKCNFMIIL